ncbi:hypothetical protein AQ436_00215 [Arthrobacter sp. EpRS66]|nr:hypothetical protein AQ436_00215 [Arthrobacter sp. EpRS66]
MGANEKHDATYHGGEYTPDADGLRDLWVDSKLDHLPRAVGIPLVPTVQAEFTRWLETVRAEAKAEALHEVLTVLNAEIEDAPPANHEEDNYEAGYIDGLMFAEKFTETRANQYKENQS